MWHIVTTFLFSVCVFCWLMTCAISIFSVLDNFCQISPLPSNEVWITRVLHLICNAHTHILLFGSKFHIILAMYVQMLDMYIENIEKIENIGYFRKYHNIFQPCYTNKNDTKCQYSTMSYWAWHSMISVVNRYQIICYTDYNPNPYTTVDFPNHTHDFCYYIWC